MKRFHCRNRACKVEIQNAVPRIFSYDAWNKNDFGRVPLQSLSSLDKLKHLGKINILIGPYLQDHINIRMTLQVFNAGQYAEHLPKPVIGNKLSFLILSVFFGKDLVI